MTVKIAPFIIEPSCNCVSTFGHEEEEHIKLFHTPITYWGIYIDDKYVSYTSNRELAEETRLWMQKWLR